MYRDDGLLVSRLTARETDIVKKKLGQIFSRYKLSLTLDANHKLINFLDVTMDLNSTHHSPYKKPNNTIQYINMDSNHPPTILKNTPPNINNRISRNSSNEEIFNASFKPYQDALNESGYKYKMKFDQNVRQNASQTQSGRRNRSRKITWFNPPFSLNVKTNVGASSLRILQECFPSNHKLYKICNKNTIKVSYRTMKNMKSIISIHNKKVLRKHHEQLHPSTQWAKSGFFV